MIFYTFQGVTVLKCILYNFVKNSIDAVHWERLYAAAELNPCHRKFGYFKPYKSTLNYGQKCTNFDKGRPLFERLKGRKPLNYDFLPFVTFAQTHFRLVEATRIELVYFVHKSLSIAISFIMCQVLCQIFKSY